MYGNLEISWLWPSQFKHANFEIFIQIKFKIQKQAVVLKIEGKLLTKFYLFFVVNFFLNYLLNKNALTLIF